jgi:hypothetical protein
MQLNLIELIGFPIDQLEIFKAMINGIHGIYGAEIQRE